jgi:hypothetical protein
VEHPREIDPTWEIGFASPMVLADASMVPTDSRLVQPASWTDPSDHRSFPGDPAGFHRHPDGLPSSKTEWPRLREGHGYFHKVSPQVIRDKVEHPREIDPTWEIGRRVFDGSFRLLMVFAHLRQFQQNLRVDPSDHRSPLAIPKFSTDIPMVCHP